LGTSGLESATIHLRDHEELASGVTAEAAAARTNRHVPLPTDVVWRRAALTSASSAVNHIITFTFIIIVIIVIIIIITMDAYIVQDSLTATTVLCLQLIIKAAKQTFSVVS